MMGGCLFHAVEGLTRMGTATKTTLDESADEEHASKLLENVVSGLGLEPRVLALKELIRQLLLKMIERHQLIRSH